MGAGVGGVVVAGWGHFAGESGAGRHFAHALLIGLFVVEGVFQIVLALRHRQTFPGRWVWLLVSGAADLLLAFIIINGWPGASFWALGLLAGVNLITTGVAILSVALEARSAVEKIATNVR